MHEWLMANGIDPDVVHDSEPVILIGEVIQYATEAEDGEIITVTTYCIEQPLAELNILSI